MRALTVAIVVASLAFGSLPVLAQGNPSADKIIETLKGVGGGSRGLRLAAPPAPAQQPRVAGKPLAVPAASAPGTAPTVSLTVNFANGSAELTPETIRALDELGRALASKDLADYRFRIEGHTDTVGSSNYKHILSARRAEAVVDYVATKYGVDPSRLQSIGMGEEGLAVPTPPQTPEPRNRRVQVTRLGA